MQKERIISTEFGMQLTITDELQPIHEIAFRLPYTLDLTMTALREGRDHGRIPELRGVPAEQDRLLLITAAEHFQSADRLSPTIANLSMFQVITEAVFTGQGMKGNILYGDEDRMYCTVAIPADAEGNCPPIRMPSIITDKPSAAAWIERRPSEVSICIDEIKQRAFVSMEHAEKPFLSLNGAWLRNERSKQVEELLRPRLIQLNNQVSHLKDPRNNGKRNRLQ